MVKNTLFYGYGNPGRQDDGLGIVFVEEMEKFIRKKNLPAFSFDTNYQLNIEDADTIKDYDMVFFCDASQEEIREFCITKVSPSDSRIEFTMHAISPAFVLDLCHKIYRKTPETYLVHIKGFSWNFMEEISLPAVKNLTETLHFFKTALRQELFFQIKYPYKRNCPGEASSSQVTSLKTQ